VDGNSRGVSVAFAHGTLTSAPAGRLVLVFDVNFLQTSADYSSHCFAHNLIAFLGAPAPALIVHDGTAGMEASVVANLTAKLTEAGYSATANVGIPGGSLADYKQIWDVRFNIATPLSPADMTAYLDYLIAGGSLFLMGENVGFAVRNNSLITFVQNVGGGTLTIAVPSSNTQTVRPPFTGPNPLATVTFGVGGAATTPPGRGTFATVDPSSRGISVAFSPGQLGNAPSGALILVFDVNFLALTADANSQTFTKNLIAYLAWPPLPKLIYLPIVLR
jgi:hypothetical protein